MFSLFLYIIYHNERGACSPALIFVWTSGLTRNAPISSAVLCSTVYCPLRSLASLGLGFFILFSVRERAHELRYRRLAQRLGIQARRIPRSAHPHQQGRGKTSDPHRHGASSARVGRPSRRPTTARLPLAARLLPKPHRIARHSRRLRVRRRTSAKNSSKRPGSTITAI